MLYHDLKSIRIHHYWATPQPQGANLLDQARHWKYPLWLPFQKPRYSDQISVLVRNRTASYGGLEKLEEIFLESAPELGSEDVMNILNTKVSEAFRLRKLSLRFCRADLQTVERLLEQKLTSLTHLTLLIGYQENRLWPCPIRSPSSPLPASTSI